MRKISFDAHLRSAASLILLASLLTACLPPDLAPPPVFGNAPTSTPADAPPSESAATLEPTRPPYPPGELVDYIAQPGDTLPVLAVRFNTTLEEIRAANTFIPSDATTMPPGMPMKIPIYYLPLWGSSYQILPDAHFINGPAAVEFDPVNFVQTSPGWLKTYSTYILDRDRNAGEVILYVATNYSVSPRLLIALLEFQIGAVSQPDLAAVSEDIQTGYPLGIHSTSARGLYRQLAAVANELNNYYYLYRSGEVREFFLSDGQMVRPDPWQNAATVALQMYFARHYSAAEYKTAVSADGLAAVFQRLFGDPWSAAPHIPGSLRQPEMRLPFPAGSAWTFTGGPHTPWGDGPPYAAIDFAPPAVVGGCISTDEFATAVASGVIARTGLGIAVLDLDGDGDERTGWVMFYLHLAAQDRLEVGQTVAAGDPIGHPSCEGGKSTGTHVHIARKYNGEWMLADGPLAYNLDGWISSSGGAPYLGTLKRNGHTVTACECSDSYSRLQAEFH